MQKTVRVLLYLAGFLALLCLLLYVTGNGHILNGISQTYLRGLSRPDIDDFDSTVCRKVPAGEHQPWAMSSAYGKTTLSGSELAFLDSLETTAYLVVWKDSILYEYYGLEGGKDVLSNSFSMAKSFTSMAVGALADRGLLDVHDPVANYLPRFSEGDNARMTVEQVLQMRSNINFGESYSNPFGYQAKAYYGDDLVAETAPYRVSGSPGTVWEYQGGNTVILAELVQMRANKSLSAWFSTCFWQRLGAEHDAWWRIDHDGGIERSFSAFYATARDFARIGKLFLHKGKWNGIQLLSRTYYDQSIRPVGTTDKNGKPTQHYGYQWWLALDAQPAHFSARGMRGQYIVVIPDSQLVVVRLGHKRIEDKEGGTMTPDLEKFVSFAIGLIPEL